MSPIGMLGKLLSGITTIRSALGLKSSDGNAVHVRVDFAWTGYRKREAKVAYKHFNPIEDPLIIGLDPRLMLMLDNAREAAGVPFFITCGRRSPETNAAQADSVKDSAHLTGLACDLDCEDDHALNRMQAGLYGAGFKRMGVYLVRAPGSETKLLPHHVHVDIDDGKPQETTWILMEK